MCTSAPILTTRGNLMVHKFQCDVLKGASAIISRQCNQGQSTLGDLRNKLLFPGRAPDSFLRTLSRNVGLDAEVGIGCFRVVEAALSTALRGYAAPVVQYHYNSSIYKASSISPPLAEGFTEEGKHGLGLTKVTTSSK